MRSAAITVAALVDENEPAAGFGQRLDVAHLRPGLDLIGETVEKH